MHLWLATFSVEGGRGSATIRFNRANPNAEISAWSTEPRESRMVLCHVRKALPLRRLTQLKTSCPHFSFSFFILILLLGQPFVSFPSGLIVRRCSCISFSFLFLPLRQLSPGLLLVFLELHLYVSTSVRSCRLKATMGRKVS